MANIKTVYLAGKITGDKKYKQKFKEAARALERAGFVVINPAMLPSVGFEYEAYIRMSVAMLLECEAVCFLSCWYYSPGARSEWGIAEAHGKEIFYFDEWQAGAARVAGGGADQNGLQYAT